MGQRNFVESHFNGLDSVKLFYDPCFAALIKSHDAMQFEMVADRLVAEETFGIPYFPR
jgi:hypothetical protein